MKLEAISNRIESNECNGKGSVNGKGRDGNKIKRDSGRLKPITKIIQPMKIIIDMMTFSSFLIINWLIPC